MNRVGFVGLGVMGAPMAGHLLTASSLKTRRLEGLEGLTVWNRTPAKAEPLRDQGATVAESLADLARECSVIMLCVNRTEDVAGCLDAMLPTANPDTLFVDHSTISPPGAVELHTKLEQAGHAFLDAPITGGSMGAQKGTLTIFCGGSQASFERALPYLQAYAKRPERVGGPGAGQMMKMANQIAVGGALLALCEALAFADRAGLDIAQTRELLAGGAAGSWAFDNYGPKIVAQDWSPGFSIKNQRKDFGYCFEAAERVQAALPGTEIVDQLLAELDDAGHGEWTTAALFEVLRRGHTG